MIAIIADDFTGAAELAGISLRYGLTVELCLQTVQYVGADVLIVCTDSRSVNEIKAVQITTSIITDILKLQPTFIYKKIDSVMRGHVLAELQIQMELTGFEKAFVFPANPSLNRIIINGEYYVYGININATSFANDPEFPIRHSCVKSMIRSSDVLVLKHNDVLPKNGIVIGEANTENDATAWVEKLDASWMLAGAGDFYVSLLHKRFAAIEMTAVKLKSPHLYVCGTAFEKRKKQIKNIDKKLNCVAYLSTTMMDKANACDNDWLYKASRILCQHKKLIIAIDESKKNATSLRTTMAKAVKEIVQKGSIKEIFIEGPSTAAAVLQELNVTKLIPLNELERGVVRVEGFSSLMQGNVGLFITVKPGSYELPKEIKKLYS
jgi:D-threonate/D-erythronate kinase